jgi:predicted nucleotidyltransferase
MLVGSHARDDRSDIDLLTIVREVEDCFGEMARLGGIIGRLLIAADAVVTIKDTMIHEALSHGRISAESGDSQ